MTLSSVVSRFIYGQPHWHSTDVEHEQSYTPIPQPPTLPLIGNILQIDRILPAASFRLLARQYGEIYSLQFPGVQLVNINSHRLVMETLDESRFHKTISPALLELRSLVGDALFTAFHGEENWAVAHRILVPAFSPANIKGMFGDMMDVASQLVLKWERYGEEYLINPSEDYTRLAFDTVALCTMGYRVNSFYSDFIQPFIISMGNYLLEAQRRTRLPGPIKAITSTAQWDADREAMNEIVTKVISDRRKTGIHRGDLLDLMLSGKDPKTGTSLSEENIRWQLLTFLIAGHETTSGMLSFITYELLKNPSAYAKVRNEIDTVLKGEPIRPEHLNKLPYVTAVMREGLRLHSTVPIFAVEPIKDTALLNQYLVRKGTFALLHVESIHRDPAVYGEDAELFRPERMLDGKFEALPPKAWIPFGNGARACIGRAFAWQEATIALATIFQRFDLVMADPSYTLKIKQTLTIKPDEFYIRAIPRANVAPLVIGKQIQQKLPVPKTIQSVTDASKEEDDGRIKVNILYGSNTGSSEAFAQRIASSALVKGFSARISTLDAASGHLSTTSPTIIITASFEGQPADNAGRFVEDLTNLSGSKLEGVTYAVFGCGNKDWVLTYQRIPRLIDETMEKLGAKRLLERGEGDAAGSEFFDAFDAWEANLWEVLGEVYNVKPLVDAKAEENLDIQVLGNGTERATSLRQPNAGLGKVVENYVLTTGAIEEKRHIEIRLPENMTYSAGDYLAVLPTNPPASVRRVLKHFNLSEEATIIINTKGATTLPTGQPVSLWQILSGYIELAQPASKRNLETLIEQATGELQETLRAMVADYNDSIVKYRISVLDLLCTYPALPVSLSTFLTMLPAMRIRQYSISSSPLWNPSHVTLTISILNSPSLSRPTEERFLGVASNFLADLKPGDLVQVMVRQSATVFSLPADVHTPIVLFCAGAGLAPMRGFIQERAMQKAAGRKDVGEILLFFGCRDPEKDYLYAKSELARWVELGVVDVRPTFSQKPEMSEGCRYVQHRVLRDADDVRTMYQKKAKFFTCGGSGLASGVREACVQILEEGCGSHEEAIEEFKRLQKERYATDIFN
ncbi:hypothetical protein FRC17_010824 [Serendipita sp. 399]|nr:hypothetical protein FRC17_010824 [Serendipita sp. 399]